jgi:uncharacterized cupin superfamily protein
MSSSIVIAATAAMELESAPIVNGWIKSGEPVARNKFLASSSDKMAHIMAWECTPGSFDWHYSEDETCVITSGEVFITQANSQERRLGPGDMVFFPAGCLCHWRVTSKVRKVAIMHSTLPVPLTLGVRIYRKLFQLVGTRRTPSAAVF